MFFRKPKQNNQLKNIFDAFGVNYDKELVRYDDNGHCVELEIEVYQSVEVDPGIFSSLENLTSLSIRGNIVLSNGLFSGLGSLKRLSITRNDIIDLRGELFEGLSNLILLGIEENDELQTIPKGAFDKLSTMEELCLDLNSLVTLPEDLFSSNKLTELRLDQNQLNELPDEIFTPISGLRKLSLSYNNLSKLPKSLLNLKELEYLDLRRNEKLPLRIQRTYDDVHTFLKDYKN